MEHFIVYKLSNDSTVSKIVTRKWIEVNDLSSGQYSASKNIRFKTPMLRSDLCVYSDAHITVKGTIDVLAVDVCGIIIEMKWIRLIIILHRLNHLNIRQKQEKHQNNLHD